MSYLPPRPTLRLLLPCFALLASGLVAADSIPWRKMPMLPPEAKAAGVFPGGEGSQWPRWNMVIARSKPELMLLPIDVGGVYRSRDGGAYWELAMEGWHARGANAFAIDPFDPDHLIGVGGNSLDWDPSWGPSPFGLYLSDDGAESWTHVLGMRDGVGGTLAFDPTSRDAESGRCRTAYYVANSLGLFRSDDGGRTWAGVNSAFAGQNPDGWVPITVAVHEKHGWVYVADKRGVHLSRDRGRSFERVAEGSFFGLSVVHTRPDLIHASGDVGLLRSEDAGLTWKKLPAAGVRRAPDEPLRGINVSPADPRRMLAWVAGAAWQWVRYVSHDGGESFTPIKVDGGLALNGNPPNAVPGGVAPLPYNVRNGYHAWHPNDPEIAFGLGGDWVTKSTDGGRHFVWSNNGYNGVMLGGHFSFSTHAPDVVFLAFQDYNGAFTLDGGQTWNYRDVSGKGWGGYSYGGHALNDRVMWYGEAETWGSKRNLRVSLDGGATWKSPLDAEGKKLYWDGPDFSLSDPRDERVLFASNWRSSDQGLTWSRMKGCEAVITTAPDGRLFGKSGDNIVVSEDHGASWKVFAAIPGGFSDLAYDPLRKRHYVASQERLKRLEADGSLVTLETPRNQFGGQRVTVVAVDPVEPAVVYAGGPNNIYTSAATVARSRDAGETWENLTTAHGPREVCALRVHPVTRELWLNGQCFGMWRLAPPADLGPAPLERRDAPVAPRAPAGTQADYKPKLRPHTSLIHRSGGFDYAYGNGWVLGKNVGYFDGVFRIDAKEDGGVGIVLQGVDVRPNGENTLVATLRTLEGNEAAALAVNFLRAEGPFTVSIPLPAAPAELRTLELPLGSADLSDVSQVQVQGVNWSPGARPLRVEISRLAAERR